MEPAVDECIGLLEKHFSYISRYGKQVLCFQSLDADILTADCSFAYELLGPAKQSIYSGGCNATPLM
jgi:hypothetical protein